MVVFLGCKHMQLCHFELIKVGMGWGGEQAQLELSEQLHLHCCAIPAGTLGEE